jgi:hypothetical protein
MADTTIPPVTPEGHLVNIGPDLLTHANLQTELARGDVRGGTAVGLAPHVVYAAPAPGSLDHWKDPKTCNATGTATCNAMSRAVAHEVDASHFGLVPHTDPASGEVTTHGFIVKDALPGQPSIQIGLDGKALSKIPIERIHDEATKRGMNGGAPLPEAAYQGAILSPYYPPGTEDLSHIHMAADARRAEGNAYQGAPRLHVPTTEEGRVVAEVAHLAAANVTPPVQARARPIEELYDAGREVDEALAHVPGWKTTEKIVREFGAGLEKIAAGEHPVKLAGDAPLTPAHQEAARKMIETGNAIGAIKADPVKLAASGVNVAASDPATPAGDALRTTVSELDAVLPGVVPHEIRRHLPRAPAAAPRPSSVVLEDDDEVPLHMTGLDRDTTLPLDVGLYEALRRCYVGHPYDGNRHPDPRMGAAPASDVTALTVPPRPGPTASSAAPPSHVVDDEDEAPEHPEAPTPPRPPASPYRSPSDPMGMPHEGYGSGYLHGTGYPDHAGSGSAFHAEDHPGGFRTGAAREGGDVRTWHSSANPWRDRSGHRWWRDARGWWRDGAIVDVSLVPAEVTQQVQVEAPLGAPRVVEASAPRPRRRSPWWYPEFILGPYQPSAPRRPLEPGPGFVAENPANQRNIRNEEAEIRRLQAQIAARRSGRAPDSAFRIRQDEQTIARLRAEIARRERDPGMAGMGWVPWGRDWLIADPNLRYAVDRYRHDAFARQLVDRGGRIRGYGRAQILAVLGHGRPVVEERAIVDPGMGVAPPGVAPGIDKRDGDRDGPRYIQPDDPRMGFHGGGGGGRGGYRGSGYPGMGAAYLGTIVDGGGYGGYESDLDDDLDPPAPMRRQRVYS